MTTNVWHAWECHTVPTFHFRMNTRSNNSMLWCQESNEKQVVTCWLLSSDSVWGTHLLTLYIFPIRCRWSLEYFIRNLEAFGKLTTSLTVASSIAAFSASPFRTCGRPLQGSSQRNKSPDLNFWNQWLVVRSFTALSLKTWRIRQFDAAVEKPTLKVIKQTTLNELFRHCHICSGYDQCVCAKHLNWWSAMPTPTPYSIPAHDALICVSVIISSHPT